MPKSTLSRSIRPESFLPFAARCVLLCFTLTFLPGCGALLVDPLLAPMEHSLEQQANLDLLHDGVPSLLLMLDGLLANNPHNRKLLISGTKAYSAYAVLLDQYQETEQARKCIKRGREHAQTLLASIPPLAGFAHAPPENLHNLLSKVGANDIAPLFWGGYGWAVWSRLQEGSPAGLAALTRIEPIMERVLELDESFYHGGAHIFLGALYGARPTLIGGRPKFSRAHFEKALALTERRFLPTLVTFAETYARQTFDRQLFKSLLEEVLAASLEETPHLKASNSLAKMKARDLLNRIDDFF